MNLQKLLNLAESQVGYAEKNSAKDVDSATAAGSANYTKYARDVDAIGLPGCQGQPWCGEYQFWLEYKVFGKETALSHLGPKFYNCFATRDWAKEQGKWIGPAGTPKPGYRVIFSQSHIALVTKVTAAKIYTNEGNTSDGTGVNRDGGRVCNKSYDRTYGKILGYVAVEYDDAATADVTSVHEVAAELAILPGTLNVRKAPGTAAPIAGHYSQGEVVAATAKTFIDGAAWFQTADGWVSGKQVEGWVHELSDVGQRWWYVTEGYGYPAGVVRDVGGKLYAFDLAGWMVTPDRVAESGEIM